FVIYFAHISDRFGRRPVMLVGLALFVAFLQPFFAMMRSNNWALILLAFTIALALHAVIFGPLAAFISEQFGTGSRYTGASMGYQLATLLGAGFTPTILASLYAASGGTSVTTVIWYLVGLAIVSATAIILTRASRSLDRESHEHENAQAQRGNSSLMKSEESLIIRRSTASSTSSSFLRYKHALLDLCGPSLA